MLRRATWATLCICICICICICVGCGREAPSAPIGAASNANAQSRARTYRVDHDGRTTVGLGGSRARLRAVTTGAAGTITVDPHDLSATRGEVKIDLLTLRSDLPPKTEIADPITTAAHSWLGVVVDDRVDEAMRWATFLVTSIDDVQPSRDAFAVAPLSGGGNVRRIVTLTARGRLTVRGSTVEKTVSLRAMLSWPSRDADDGPPSSFDVTTVEPMTVAFTDHGVGPPRRTPFTSSEWVGSTVDVTIDLSAR